MLIKMSEDMTENDITAESVYKQRRLFLQAGSALALLGSGLLSAAERPGVGRPLQGYQKTPWGKAETLTPYRDITSYNNFYEFSTDKEEPALLAKNLKTSPWDIVVEGEVERPGKYHLEDLVPMNKLEERIYRLRCVEAWSMVIPWIGIPLATVIKRLQPTSKAKYVEFTTLFDPKQMPNQNNRLLDWPYVEGLRMDEAMHPLTLLAVGLYGEVMPNQNGAPVRLVVPWKYGFKNIKSIARIRFTEQQPVSAWMKASSREYGFYANVNPQVSHPRWSQAKERRIGEFRKRETLMFNGYGEQVAGLYTGMDLKRFF